MTALLWIAIAVAGAVGEWALANHRNVDRGADARSSDRMLRVGVAIALCVPVMASLITGSGSPVALVLLGFVVGAAGVLLRASAMRTLGKRYTLTPQRQSTDHALCRVGPYRWVRHPGYTGLLAQFLGMGAMVAPIAGIAATIPLMVFVLLRIGGEEKLLDAEFADEYGKYRAAVPSRLVPWLL
jgi:protein-S-isoprenylcysteine O-methyltransferase Ste14